MVASGTSVRYEILAQNLFDAITQFCLAVPRTRRQPGNLKEIEYLALALLRHHEPQIVGDLQRQLGILPAQMSRIIRSLEDREHPLIACRINTHDKRKIDVGLTDEGTRACRDHQAERVNGIARLLAQMSDHELEDLGRLIDRFRERVEQLLTETRLADERGANGPIPV